MVMYVDQRIFQGIIVGRHKINFYAVYKITKQHQPGKKYLSICYYEFIHRMSLKVYFPNNYFKY